jgi:formamidopyrimidine-DNA glycosylase
MPELPEVETVRRALAREVAGSRILRVTGRSIAMRRPLRVERLAATLDGRRFAAPRRRGKFLLLDVKPPGTILCHLGMSGRLMLQRPDDPIQPHTHITFQLSTGRELRFVDPRRFGLMDWIPPGDELRDPSLRLLGPEPLDPEIERWLPQRLEARRAPLKALLLDQRIVAGVGNIYAVEALWRAGIRPSRQARRTSRNRLERLAREIRAVLSEAVEEGGTTIRDYAQPSGNFGYFAVHLEAYGRQGEPCRRCGHVLRADIVGGRTTAWCPGCQR